MRSARCLLLLLFTVVPGCADSRAPQRSSGSPWFELRGGVASAFTTFAEQGRGRVAFLGGSITFNPGWRELVCSDLEARFPATEFEFIHAGIPSMGSTPGAFRIARDVFSRGPIDLLFVEAAVNDASNGRSALEMLRGMEGIVRRARSESPPAEVVLLHFADPDKLSDYDAGRTPEVIAVHERVAAHYGVASLDLAREVSDRIAGGEFTWRDDFRDLHPSPFGQALYARSIAHLFDHSSEAVPAPAGERELPALLDSGSYAHGRLVEPSAAEWDDGWRLVSSWRPEDGAGTRPGFVDVPMLVGETPAAELRWTFTGTGAGIFVAAGPDAGMIETSIDGSAFQTLDLYTRWSAGLHLPFAHVLAAGLDDREHVLSLRIRAEKNSRSAGNACRIAHFLLNSP